jgi:hypothetical protein
MPNAAFPTDFIVKAEKAYGSIAPNSRHANIKGSLKDTSELEPSKPVVCRYAPYSAKATRVALPIAKPLPIAAVVFPAESKASVRFLIYSPS